MTSRPSMDGILVIDKPPGITSAQAVARIKRMTGEKKVGHTGTLDPFATGVLVCCLGRATRLARFFLHGDKSYEAVMVLGVETDTQDLSGQVVSRSVVPEISEDAIREVFSRFTGEIAQAPPVFSALKHQGVPLYKLARRGTPVQKPARKVTIGELKLLEMQPDRVRFSASCSGGTYIRTLCSDIGKALGCGAHLVELRRTSNSGFNITEALTPEALAQVASQEKTASVLVSMADALRRIPQVTATPLLAKKISHGEALTRHDLGQKKDWNGEEDSPNRVKVVNAEGNLLAVLDAKPDGMGFSYVCVFVN